MWYRLHYDMLRGLTPKIHPDANSRDCVIGMTSLDGKGPFLDAYPMEGDAWEHCLTKELKLSPEVTALWPEIAACCLWHTSYYGFIPHHLDEMAEFFRFARLSDREKAAMYVRQIKGIGGHVPSLSQLNSYKKNELIHRTKEDMRYRCYKENRQKRKRAFRQTFMSLYYERITAISRFILETKSAWKDSRSTPSVPRLCGLYDSMLFREEKLPSYVCDDMDISAAKYLENLIRKYPFIERKDFNRVIIHLVTGEPHERLNDDEQALINYIIEGGKGGQPFESSDFLISTDPSLGKQITLHLAFYKSDRPL